jgi:guanosine-3',5'-bis(diphosphate) 3'-pyrophosphohydrolase
MPKVTSAQNSNQTNTVCDEFFDGQPQLRTHQIKHIDDYETEMEANGTSVSW